MFYKLRIYEKRPCDNTGCSVPRFLPEAELTSLSYDHLVGFGEGMVRLSTPLGESLVNSPTLYPTVGGAELNGLIAATAFGMPSKWVSAVNDDVAGRRILKHASSYGLELSVHLTDTARTGLYFVEVASYPRSTRVFYDRSWSAASLLGDNDIDWPELIRAQTCFYSSGITAGISESAKNSVEKAIDYATEIGAVVALDTNYRSKLWATEEAYDWVTKMMPKINILSVNHAELESLDQPTDDPIAARESLGVDILIVTSKSHRLNSVDVKIQAVNQSGSFETSGEAVVLDPFGAGDAMFGAFLATMPTTGIEAAIETALKAALITYGVHGDAMTVDPNVTLEGGRILR